MTINLHAHAMNSLSDGTPRRVQRKREKGWRLPENTKCVTRPGPWGNPFDSVSEFSEAVECCSELRHVPKWMDFEKGQRILWMCEHLDELNGLNLACWCPPEKRCHADMLLIWANCETSQDPISRPELADDCPDFLLLDFNVRRKARGAEAARVQVDPNGDWLWMSKVDLKRNIELFGRHPELVKALEHYR